VQGNLAALFADRPDVFVAGDLLWYPVEGRPDICRAPDVMVAIGRPKGSFYHPRTVDPCLAVGVDRNHPSLPSGRGR
jgi:hypothetical protein